MMHRNLYVANRDPNCEDQSCLCCSNSPESMLHLAECSEIRDAFWNEWLSLMKKLGIKCNNNAIFLVLGVLGPDKVVDKEGAGMLAIAWRCLYAEIVSARVDRKQVDLARALKRATAMLISRIKAYTD